MDTRQTQTHWSDKGVAKFYKIIKIFNFDNHL
jgi:hypothetical protein